MAALKKITNATVDTTAKAVKAEPAKITEKVAGTAAAKSVAEKSKAEKAEVRKPAVKKAEAKKPVKKVELKSELHIQFEGKSYSQEDLLKMAKDVWKYDLKQKARELSSVELYVKPEENLAYYVMNKEFTGSFYI